MIRADFEPGFFFLLLWGLISWLSRKKKKKLHTDSNEVVTKTKENLFARLEKLQEHLSNEVDILPPTPQPVESEEQYFAQEHEYSSVEPEILEPELEDVHGNEESIFTKDDLPILTETTNWLKKNISSKSDLMKIMVLKEVLGEPRSLKPYTGDYFQS